MRRYSSHQYRGGTIGDVLGIKRALSKTVPELVPGDARVFWEGGNLDYSFAQICDAILSTLRASARPHPQAEDRT